MLWESGREWARRTCRGRPGYLTPIPTPTPTPTPPTHAPLLLNILLLLLLLQDLLLFRNLINMCNHTLIANT